MFDIAHFIMVLYVCIMSPYNALQFQQESEDVEKVFTTIVFAGLLLNIYLQLTTAIVEKVSLIYFVLIYFALIF